MFFHIFLFYSSILLWNIIFLYSHFKPYYRSENKIAIANNLQVIFFSLLVYHNFKDEYDLGMFQTYTLSSFQEYLPPGDGLREYSLILEPQIKRFDFKLINSIIAYSTHLSLAYNLSDIFIQIYKKKWVYVIHHLSLLPFLLGYLFEGIFYHLYFIYGLLEVSSLSFNIRQIFPVWDTPHKFLYILVRIIATPLLILGLYNEVSIKFSEISLYWIISGCFSTFLLLIFNSVSVFLALKSFLIQDKKD